jgi:hypothetical protein
MFPFCQQNKTKTKKLKKTLFESGFHKVDTGFFLHHFCLRPLTNSIGTNIIKPLSLH